MLHTLNTKYVFKKIPQLVCISDKLLLSASSRKKNRKEKQKKILKKKFQEATRETR